MKDQPVTINGVAQNGKAGALVKASDDKVYYIEGLSVWPADMQNKPVTVTGNLIVEAVSEEKLRNEQGEWSQGIAGQINKIQHATWRKR